MGKLFKTGKFSWPCKKRVVRHSTENLGGRVTNIREDFQGENDCLAIRGVKRKHKRCL